MYAARDMEQTDVCLKSLEALTRWASVPAPDRENSWEIAWIMWLEVPSLVASC